MLRSDFIELLGGEEESTLRIFGPEPEYCDRSWEFRGGPFCEGNERPVIDAFARFIRDEVYPWAEQWTPESMAAWLKTTSNHLTTAFHLTALGRSGEARAIVTSYLDSPEGRANPERALELRARMEKAWEIPQEKPPAGP